MNDDLVAKLPKKIAKELSGFGAEAKSKHQKAPAKTRVQQTLDAPAHVLAMDSLLQDACDRRQGSSSLRLVQREQIIEKLLVCQFAIVYFFSFYVILRPEFLECYF